MEVVPADELRLIGYWDGPQTRPGWPKVADFVDPSLDTDEREFLADYLARGHVVRAFGGVSECRLCGRDNGALELSDGLFVWPDGLSHYVLVHSVRLPREFVQHARNRIEAMEAAENVEEWWKSRMGMR